MNKYELAKRYLISKSLVARRRVPLRTLESLRQSSGEHLAIQGEVWWRATPGLSLPWRWNNNQAKLSGLVRAMFLEAGRSWSVSDPNIWCGRFAGFCPRLVLRNIRRYWRARNPLLSIYYASFFQHKVKENGGTLYKNKKWSSSPSSWSFSLQSSSYMAALQQIQTTMIEVADSTGKQIMRFQVLLPLAS